MGLDMNMMLKGNYVNQPWEQDSGDSKQVSFRQQQKKGWGRGQGAQQLSQQSPPSPTYVGLFSLCKLSAFRALLSEFSQPPQVAGGVEIIRDEACTARK